MNTRILLIFFLIYPFEVKHDLLNESRVKEQREKNIILSYLFNLLKETAGVARTDTSEVIIKWKYGEVYRHEQNCFILRCDHR